MDREWKDRFFGIPILFRFVGGTGEGGGGDADDGGYGSFQRVYNRIGEGKFRRE